MKKINFKKLIIIAAPVLLVILIAGYFISGKKSEISYNTALVERGKIIQTVSETGTVKAANEIILSFLSSGKIGKINVSIGDKIKKDQILVELDNSSLEIKKEETEANLNIAEGDLNKLLAGATVSEIEVARANVRQAKSSYESSKKELEKTKASVQENISQAEKTLDDLNSSSKDSVTAYEQAVTAAKTSLESSKSTYQRAIDNKIETALSTLDNNLAKANTAIDTIDRTINDPDGKDYISVKDNGVALRKTSDFYEESVKYLSASLNLLAAAELNNTSTNVIIALSDAINTLNQVFKNLQYCYSTLENSITSSSFTQTELDTLKVNISAEITTISTSISSVQTAKQNLDDAILGYDTNVKTAEDALSKAQTAYDDAVRAAENALATAKVNSAQQITSAETKVSGYFESWKVAEAELNRIIAPASKYDIALAQAKVKQAQASLDSVKKQIEDTIIKAPIDGTITKIDYEIGEQAVAGSPVAAVLGENNFEIEVLISEADIARVKRDNEAQITLDSFGSDIKFDGKVYFIEPAETEIQDVVYYKVKVNFDPKEYSIKSGMTANVLITAAEKDNILIIPSRAVVEKNGQGKIVRVFSGENIEERQVVLGISGDDGVVEILSGLEEGEKIIVSVKDNVK